MPITTIEDEARAALGVLADSYQDTISELCTAIEKIDEAIDTKKMRKQIINQTIESVEYKMMCLNNMMETLV